MLQHLATQYGLTPRAAGDTAAVSAEAERSSVQAEAAAEAEAQYYATEPFGESMQQKEDRMRMRSAHSHRCSAESDRIASGL